jgi:hypothetical protein
METLRFYYQRFVMQFWRNLYSQWNKRRRVPGSRTQQLKRPHCRIQPAIDTAALPVPKHSQTNGVSPWDGFRIKLR